MICTDVFQTNRKKFRNPLVSTVALGRPYAVTPGRCLQVFPERGGHEEKSQRQGHQTLGCSMFIAIGRVEFANFRAIRNIQIAIFKGPFEGIGHLHPFTRPFLPRCFGGHHEGYLRLALDVKYSPGIVTAVQSWTAPGSLINICFDMEGVKVSTCT